MLPTDPSEQTEVLLKALAEARAGDPTALCSVSEQLAAQIKEVQKRTKVRTRAAVVEGAGRWLGGCMGGRVAEWCSWCWHACWHHRASGRLTCTHTRACAQSLKKAARAPTSGAGGADVDGDASSVDDVSVAVIVSR